MSRNLKKRSSLMTETDTYYTNKFNKARGRYELLSSIDENYLNSTLTDSNNNSYTIDELKNFLRRLGLKVSGSKNELVERLLFEKSLLDVY